LASPSKFPDWLQPAIQLLLPIYRKLRPRLGVLRQYPPRQLKLPANYGENKQSTSSLKISLVTPSFNQSKFLEKTIHSVLDQNYPTLEYFVQDGGSTDGTLELLQRIGHRLTSWESAQDRGQAQAINIGFEKTSGEVMAWLNSDDILLPGSLAYIAKYFTDHPEVDIVYGHRILVDENDDEIGSWIMPAHDNSILSWADFIPQETLFWRRCLWDKTVQALDETFQFAIDWDLLLRFRNAGASFARLPRFIGGFRIHADQKTSTSMANVGEKEMSRLRQRSLGRIPAKAEVDYVVRKYLLRHLLSEWLWRFRMLIKLI